MPLKLIPYLDKPFSSILSAWSDASRGFLPAGVEIVAKHRNSPATVALRAVTAVIRGARLDRRTLRSSPAHKAL
jgi:hypothetical protein